MNDKIWQAINFFYPALALERMFSHAKRRALKRIFLILFILFSTTGGLVWLLLFFHGLNIELFSPYFSQIEKILVFLKIRIIGFSMIMLAVFLFLSALDGLYYSLVSRRFLIIGATHKESIGFDVAQVFFLTKKFDIVHGLLYSNMGRALVKRLGLSRSAVKNFLRNRKQQTVNFESTLKQKHSAVSTTCSGVVSLALSDPTFSNFLMAEGVVKQDVYSALIFVQNLLTRELLSEQWWSTINLKRFKGIGEEWAYGGAWTLRKYAKDFAKQDVYGSSALGSNIGSKETDALETILARSHETNALLVGDDRVSISITLARLQDAISRNDAPKQLQYKKMLVLNGESLLASIDNQADFEKILVRIFEDASKAGNIILIFEELPIFSNNVRHRFALALDTLIDPYLRSDKIQIIATSSAQGFNREFGEDGAFAERFEQVFVRPVGTDGLVELLEARIMQIEKRHKIFFIYSAIRALADCAEEYSGFGSILDTALDLLDEAVVKAMKKHKSTITQQDISTLFEEKTGIPSGAITNIEREKLLNMETILHKRVIGQHSAIEAVAGAIRRARSGLASRSKPISSFLFLGSTGVGKTEVAKALAQAFFDGEDKMIRFDMSEYSGEDALERLIGSSKSGDPGMLANYLRQKPYGVVLFDEFEKANEVVHDLFLQILDEGFFSDMHGKRVSARNTIIIATSNAGSDYIWDIAKNNEDPSRHKDQIIKRLIDTHTFKPELINRFDATIVFHPLSRADLSSIAKILLHALQDKLAQKGYKFVITHEIVQFIVDNGYDPAFGARPMKRAISDILERYIAGRIIAGDIKPGESVQFSSEELRTLAS